MTHTTCELLWISSLLTDMGIPIQHPIPMYCDNKAATFIANNPAFHECTKHIEVDCHFIRDAVMRGQICTPFLQSSKQLADIFTKALPKAHFMKIMFKLGMRDVYVPVWGGVLCIVCSMESMVKGWYMYGCKYGSMAFWIYSFMTIVFLGSSSSEFFLLQEHWVSSSTTIKQNTHSWYLVPYQLVKR